MTGPPVADASLSGSAALDRVPAGRSARLVVADWGGVPRILMAAPVPVPELRGQRARHAGADRLAVDDGHWHDAARGRADQNLRGAAQVPGAQPPLLSLLAGL